MPPSRMVETISWGIARMTGVDHRQRDARALARASAAYAWKTLLSLVPRAQRDPLGAQARELLGPHGDELAVLPLEHVVLDARVAVLAGLVELHAPTVDGGAYRQVHCEDGGAELVEIVRLGSIEHELQHPETAAGELMAARRNIRSRLRLHGLTERALDPLSLWPHLLDDEAW